MTENLQIFPSFKKANKSCQIVNNLFNVTRCLGKILSVTVALSNSLLN